MFGRRSATDARRPYGRSYWKVIWYCMIVGIACMTFGLDTGETAGFLAMQSFLKDFGYFNPMIGAYDMTAGDQTRMYGIEIGFALLGCLSAGYIGARFGRKVPLFLTAAVCMLGAGIQMIPTTGGLLVGRALMGVGIGFSGVFAIAYWSEVTPVELRGQVVMFYQVFITIAGFIGSCVNQGTYALPTALAYRIPLIVAIIFPFCLAVLIWLVPESPRWLVTRDRIEEARINLRRIRGSTYAQEDLDKEMQEVIKFTAMEQEIEHSSSYWDCFTGSDLRRTIVPMVLFPGQQAMGVGFLAGYLTYFFFLTGFTDAFVISVISAACNIAGAFASFWLIPTFGRRPLLIVGASVNAFCMFAFAIISVADPGSIAASRSVAAFICIFCFSYSATWGTVVPVVTGEIPSNRLRSKSVALGLSCSWIFTMLVICGVPYLINSAYANLGTKVGFIFGGMTVPLIFFVIFFVPETKGRTLEEIDEMYLNGISVLKFKSYVCTGNARDLNGEAVLEAIEQKDHIRVTQIE